MNDIREWVQGNIAKIDENATIFSFGTWWLWKWRNDNVFSSTATNPTPHDKANFILRKAKEYLQVERDRNTCLGLGAPQKSEALISWTPPPQGWTKINTDRAAKCNPNFAGCGGLIRDWNGNFLGGFVKPLEVCTAIQAEIHGALNGFQIARELGIQRAVLEVDSKVFFGWLTGESIPNGPCRNLVIACRECLNKPGCEFCIKNIFRQANFATDWLASNSLNYTEGLHFFDDLPAGLNDHIVNDLIGVTQPRLI